MKAHLPSSQNEGTQTNSYVGGTLSSPMMDLDSKALIENYNIPGDTAKLLASFGPHNEDDEEQGEVEYVDIAASPEIMKKVTEMISSKRIMQFLVEHSKPDGTNLTEDNTTRADDLDAWRQNILTNYNELMDVTQNEVFDLETEQGAFYRSRNFTGSLEHLGVKQAKLDYKQAKIENRQKYTGKKRRNEKDVLKDTRDEKIDKIKRSSEEFEAEPNNLSNDMVGRQPEENYATDPSLNFKENKRKAKEGIDKTKDDIHEKRNGLAKVFSSIGKFFREKFKVDIPGIGENSYAPVLDPEKDMDFALKDKQYHFHFAPISLNDITPLVTPRANDSLIDEAGSDQEDIYSRLAGLDNDAVLQDNDYSSEDRELLKEKYQKEVNTYVSGGDKLNSDAKSEWETAQAKETREDLSTKYTDLYGFTADSHDWMSKNGDKMGEDLPYDSNGCATTETMVNFFDWIAIHVPSKVDGVSIAWDEGEWKFTAGGDKPEGGQKKEDYDSESSTYKKQKEKASELNKLIGGGGANPDIKGWQIEELKLKFLTELSIELIEPQKWSANPVTTGIDMSNEYSKAGTVKDDKSKTDIGEDLATVRTFVEGQGEYNKEDSKRYSGYDDKTGEYLNKPDERATKVSEKIIWMVNYKIDVFEKRPVEKPDN